MNFVEKAKHAMNRWRRRSRDSFGLDDAPGWEDAHRRGVSEKTALRIATAYACTRIIAETISVLPMVLMRETRDGRKQAADALNEHDLVRYSPNEWSTATDFMETTMISLILSGDGFMWTPRDNDGTPVRLVFLPSELVDVTRPAGQIMPRYSAQTINGGHGILTLGEDLVHCKAFSTDGLRGNSVLRDHARTLRIAQSQEDYSEALYANGVISRGILETDADLEGHEMKKIKKEFKESYGGPANAGKTIVLPFGAKYKPLSLSPADAQMIETFNYQERQICKLFRVPLHMVGNLEKSAFTNIEQQSTDFVQNTLMTWAVRLESALNAWLLTPYQRKKGYYYKLRLQALLRGVAVDRWTTYGIGVDKGILTPNEVRALEDMNPIEGGDELRPPPNASITADGGMKNGENTGESGKKDEKTPKDPQKVDEKPKKTKDKKSLNLAELALVDAITDAFERAERRLEKGLARLTTDEQRSKFREEHKNYVHNIVWPPFKRAMAGFGVVIDADEAANTLNRAANIEEVFEDLCDDSAVYQVPKEGSDVLLELILNEVNRQ